MFRIGRLIANIVGPTRVKVTIDPEPPAAADGVEIVHIETGALVEIGLFRPDGRRRLLWIVPAIPPQSFVPARVQEEPRAALLIPRTVDPDPRAGFTAEEWTRYYADNPEAK